ncbi:MAG TPA: hypothetical protein VFS66_02830 [Acidimicrobiia bacterium]|nr:hypothetical protein [Acidimicrobiia bacterium]
MSKVATNIEAAERLLEVAGLVDPTPKQRSLIVCLALVEIG